MENIMPANGTTTGGNSSAKKRQQKRQTPNKRSSLSSRIDSRSPNGTTYAWKSLMKSRCVARVRESRAQLIQDARNSCSLRHAIKGIIHAEKSSQESKNDEDLTEEEYIDLIQYLEETLEEEMKAIEEERLIQEQIEYEEASLAAALEGLEF